MSLLDSVRQTLSDAAHTARDVGQNLGAQAQAQLQLRKLQLEQARKLNELGARTYEWHRAGQLVATGQVPREVQELCIHLDDLGAQITVETHKLEEAKRQAELRAAKAEPVEAFDVSNADSGGAPGTFPAASATTDTIVAPIAVAPVVSSAPPAPIYSTPGQSTPTTEPTIIIPISTPSNPTGGNTTMQNTTRTNATMPLTPAPMPFPAPTTFPSMTPSSMTLSPMEAPGTYALIPGPDVTPPQIPGTPGPDTSPMPTPGGPGNSPPLMPDPSGPGAPSPLPPSSPGMPPSPGSMPTM